MYEGGRPICRSLDHARAGRADRAEQAVGLSRVRS